MGPIGVEWPLLKVQRSVAWQDDAMKVTAAAAMGLQNLAGGYQPETGIYLGASEPLVSGQHQNAVPIIA